MRLPLLVMGLVAGLLVSIQQQTPRVNYPLLTPKVTPRAVSTRQPRRYGLPKVQREINRIVIHHTAANEASVAEIRKGHLKRNFRDIAYHYVVFPSGRIECGRNIQVEGAGVWGRHAGMVEIVLVGKLHQVAPTLNQWKAATEFVAAWSEAKDIPLHRVVGHRETAALGHGTLCPGLNMQEFRLHVAYVRNSLGSGVRTSYSASR
jgi:hypothetical protein